MVIDERIAQGVRRFREQVFPERQELYRELGHQQAPEVLFIGCIDSRVVPAELCNTGPGEMFVERTPGNLVPIYRAEAVGVSASIEYAVSALRVSEIIVCGHSDCGALKGLLQPEHLANLPAVARWLRYAQEALAQVTAAHPHAVGEHKLALLCQFNVRVQLRHLLSHPAVRARVDDGSLRLRGWVYDIPTGQVAHYDERGDHFALWPPD